VRPLPPAGRRGRVPARILVPALALLTVAAAFAPPSPPIQGPARGRAADLRLLRQRLEKRSFAELPAEGAWVPGEVLVRFRAGVGRARARDVHARLGARVIERIPPLRVDVVRIPGGASVPEAIARYMRDPAVEVAEPNFRLHPLQALPTDPLFPDQWGLHNTGQPFPVTSPPPGLEAAGAPDADIDAPEAWAVTMGSPDTVIAVIDTGVDLTHPDLVPSLWVNADEVPGNGLDDDLNGYPDDVWGWDFEENDPVPQDLDGHGTHVAGIIAAAANNGVGGAGVCPRCRVMVLRFAFDLGSELAAIEYAVQNGADIINMSLGGPYFSVVQWAAIAWAGVNGVLAVVSAGNAFGDNDMKLLIELESDRDDALDCCPLYPASYDLPNIISVAASNAFDEYGYQTGCALLSGDPTACADPAGVTTTFSNLGHESVDLAAPGVDILSTFPPGTYGPKDGTSMAAPYVAGVAGLVKSAHPTYGPLEIKNAILNSVDRPDGLRYLYLGPTDVFPGSFTLTDGRVNALRALSASPATLIPRSDGNVSGARPMRAVVRGKVAWPEDVNDVYRKRLVRGRAYGVLLDVPRGQDFDLYVWKPGTLEIWQCWSPGRLGTPCMLARSGTRGTGKDEVFVFRPRKTGTYYFHVSSWFSRGRYALVVVPL
jgi:subtilisin family serine protease